MSQSIPSIAATISNATGPVSVVRDGKTITLKQGDAVYATDTISTGKESVELSFVDGASAMLSPETTMTVQEFSADMDAPSFVLNLAAGAMRTISGEVVDQNPDAFKIVTPKATVGIRGTTVNTQVKNDGSEVHAVESLSQGHNVTVVAADGTLITISAINQGALIGAESDSEATPYNFSTAEMQHLVNIIVGGLQTLADDEAQNEDDAQGEEDDNDEGENQGEDDGEDEGEDETESDLSVELDQSLIASLTQDSLDDLVAGLEDAGIDVVGLGDDLSIDAPTSGAGGEDSLVVTEDSEDGPATLYFSTTGVESFSADAGITSGYASNSIITISGNIGSDTVTISGDIGDFSEGSLIAGSDTINAQSMSDGRVVGDANIVSGGTFISGSDLINVTSKTGGNSIYGDMYEAGGGNITFGHDTINITGELSNSTIAGDALYVGDASGGAFSSGAFGNDVISVGSLGTGGKIYGDAAEIKGDVPPAAGTNSITVRDEMESGNIYGGRGVDNISVGTFTAGTINSDDGNDNIRITTMDGGTIYAGSGNDSITIGTMNAGTIHGNEGNNNISIGTYESGYISGNENGSDTLTITGTVNSQMSINAYDIDEFVFNNIGSGGSVGFNDSAAKNITVKGGSGGIINTGPGIDTINITGGSVTINTSENTVGAEGIPSDIVNHSTTGTTTITGTGGVTVAGVMQQGTIQAHTASDVVVTQMRGGKIEGNAEANSITINSFSGGTIDGGAGNDTVNVRVNGSLASNSIINCSEGNDTLTVDAASVGSITVQDFTADADVLKILNSGGSTTTISGNEIVTTNDGEKTLAAAIAAGNTVTFYTGEHNFQVDITFAN